MIFSKSILERIEKFKSIHEINNAIMHDFFKNLKKKLIIARLV